MGFICDPGPENYTRIGETFVEERELNLGG